MGGSYDFRMTMPALSLVALFLTLAVVGCAAAPAYDEAALAEFRAEREAILLADDGWFTVAGLHFLAQGENTVGSAPDNDIVLAYLSVPAHAGVVTMTGTEVTIRAATGTELELNGEPAPEGPLRLEADNRPADLVSFGDVAFFLHYSGPRLALRVRDQNAPLRRDYSGLKWFDPDPEFVATGTFVPATDEVVVEVPNILGDLEPFTVAGTVIFELGGESHTMEAWRSGERLWFVFRDRTSENLTYSAARFLYVDMPQDGSTVVLDFNYARNPPCAYNEWTTCPLPPERNQLAVRIEAGELRYHPDG